MSFPRNDICNQREKIKEGDDINDKLVWKYLDSLTSNVSRFKCPFLNAMQSRKIVACKHLNLLMTYYRFNRAKQSSALARLRFLLRSVFYLIVETSLFSHFGIVRLCCERCRGKPLRACAHAPCETTGSSGDDVTNVER